MVDLQAVATTITAEEQLRRRLGVIRRVATDVSSDRLRAAYGALYKTLEDFKSLNILPFSSTAEAIHQSLMVQKMRIGTRDL